ncbi:ATP-binding protein [Streptomyces sp. NPDC053048]|uniref:ATP-binding protein n=1 Tax=Streptomyces sp. NPDC053048 TaxID=3365694 RepID=UPI0037CD5030
MATVSPENPWFYSLTMARDPRAARIARLTLRGVMASHDMDDLSDLVELLASELVTNSYLHSDGPAELRVRQVDGDNVRISVWDTNPEVPAPFDRPVWRGKLSAPAFDPEATCGRGLLLVRLCANSWGSWSIGESFPGVTGKLLWCEVGRTPGPFGIAA